MKSRHGGQDRVSTKAKLAGELVILGEVLVRARERAKLKQSDVATRLNLPASYLSKIENGTRRLDVIELIHIADAMDVDAADIVRELEKRLKESKR
ncbi:MAG TPA: helix-turn-helix transcriptional regulator [Thermoanaerobaculia bacterium]|jgi:transcriptional regulator with XRE-family HTH domain